MSGEANAVRLNAIEDFLAQDKDDEHPPLASKTLPGNTRFIYPYRVQFQVVDTGAGSAQVDIEVCAQCMGDATVKAGEIARRDYGDTAKATGIVTYFHPRASG